MVVCVYVMDIYVTIIMESKISSRLILISKVASNLRHLIHTVGFLIFKLVATRHSFAIQYIIHAYRIRNPDILEYYNIFMNLCCQCNQNILDLFQNSKDRRMPNQELFSVNIGLSFHTFCMLYNFYASIF